MTGEGRHDPCVPCGSIIEAMAAIVLADFI
jgi:chorismate synthase